MSHVYNFTFSSDRISFSDKVPCSTGYPWAYHPAKSDLELLTSFSIPSECWDYRHTSPLPVWVTLGTESRALCRLTLINWATSLSLHSSLILRERDGIYIKTYFTSWSIYHSHIQPTLSKYRNTLHYFCFLSYRESSRPPMYLYSWHILVWPNYIPSTNGPQKRRHRLKVLTLSREFLEQWQQICRGFFSPGEVLQGWPLGNLLEMQNVRGHIRTTESNSVCSWAIGAFTRPHLHVIHSQAWELWVCVSHTRNAWSALASQHHQCLTGTRIFKKLTFCIFLLLGSL